MPLTNYGEQQAIDILFGSTASAWPAQTSGNYYIGLIKATGTWTASTAYTSNQLIIPYTGFGSIQRLYRCTTAGTTGSTEPTWPTTANGTVTDGSVVWTEVTDYFFNGTATTSPLTTYEVSASGYARQALANTSTGSTWSTPGLASSLATGTSTQWGANLTFPSSGTTSAAWGYVCGFFLAKNVTTADGVIYAWNTLSNFVPLLTSGMTLSLPSTGPGVKVTLT